MANINSNPISILSSKEMDKLYIETLFKLETTVTQLEIEADCSIQRIEAVIHLIVECLSELNEYVLKKWL